ncbi:universal stress protein [Zavarzinia sp. CC-PAN008]|uniref:universal stress protein n=1 Tax=Zavarzinia sp. CC-PAN008 TaxID=3243332 RepID=UPI003F74883D
MTIRKILVPHDGMNDSTPALVAAAALARRFGAEVEVFHPRLDPAQTAAMMGVGTPAVGLELLITASEKEARLREDKARAAFDAFLPQAGDAVAARFVTRTGPPEALLASAGRLADLTILVGGSRDHESLLDSLVMATARPILLVPAGAGGDLAGPVVVAWTDALPAARALRAGLPFLAGTPVHVLHVGSARDTANLPEVGRYLGLHGVAATTEVLDPGTGSAAAALIARAQALGAGLLISGAYGHSRLRELVLGGTTRELIQSCPLPLLVAH